MCCSGICRTTAVGHICISSKNHQGPLCSSQVCNQSLIPGYTCLGRGQRCFHRGIIIIININNNINLIRVVNFISSDLQALTRRSYPGTCMHKHTHASDPCLVGVAPVHITNIVCCTMRTSVLLLQLLGLELLVLLVTFRSLHPIWDSGPPGNHIRVPEFSQKERKKNVFLL